MRYMMDEEHGLELVLTENSERNYPLHNHVSVDIVGLVTGGSVRTVIAGTEKICNPGEFFVVPAYMPHVLECIQPYSLIVLCMRTHREKSTENDLMELGRQIEQYPQQSMSIEEMAEKIFLSKYQMIRNFKREVGLTPHRFLLQNRVRYAQRMLQQQKDLTTVAYDSGFCDQSHFIRSFEKLVGLTPTEYRAAFCRAKVADGVPTDFEDAVKILIQCRDEFCEKI